MSKTIHMCLSVRGVLKYSPRELRRACTWILKADGSMHTPDSLREALMDELAEGHEVLPMSSKCEGFDYKTGCPGHETAPVLFSDLEQPDTRPAAAAPEADHG